MPLSPDPSRPSLSSRKSSSTSHVSQSPNDLPVGSQKATQGPRKHVVGGGRLGPRQSSFGKNLSKVGRSNSARDTSGEEDKSDAKDKSATSGNDSPPNSPRPGHLKRNTSGFTANARNSSQVNLKKNLSSGQLKKNVSSTHLKKNLSSGHLTRNVSSRGLQRAHKPDVLTSKKAKAKADAALKSPRSPKSPKSPKPRQQTVRFDVNKQVEAEDSVGEWTEDSNSTSPVLTRDNTRTNTRSNSVNIDPQEAAAIAHEKSPLSQQQTANGISSEDSHHAHAEAITSRLLQRHPPHANTPQPSTVIAGVSARTDSTSDSIPRSTPTHSTPSVVGSANVGSANVSRFLDYRDSSLTASGSYLTNSISPGRGLSARNDSRGSDNQLNMSGLHDNSNRRKSPSIHSTRDPSPPRGKGPGSTFSRTSLPDRSRTQQKLNLQRASSALDTESARIPAVLPRGNIVLPPDITIVPSDSGFGRDQLDPRVLLLFRRADEGVRSVRRFSSPVLKSAKRVLRARREYPAPDHASTTSTIHEHHGAHHARTGSKLREGHSHHATFSLSTSPEAEREHGHSHLNKHDSGFAEGSEREHHHNHRHRDRDRDQDPIDRQDRKRRPKVSFEGIRDESSPEAERALSRKSSRLSMSSEAEDICRRLWIRGEVGSGD